MGFYAEIWDGQMFTNVVFMYIYMYVLQFYGNDA